jgi:uncharacterized protein (DUF488 family)
MKIEKGVAQFGKKRQSETAVVFTIGHSNVSIEVFLELLSTANIQTVIDCRSKPSSRWRQFCHSALARHLVYADIFYEWRGSNIGGLGKNVGYQATLTEIADRATRERIAIMCSEGKPEQCHRGTDLAPELEKRGVVIEHLRYGNDNQGRLL